MFVKCLDIISDLSEPKEKKTTREHKTSNACHLSLKAFDHLQLIQH